MAFIRSIIHTILFLSIGFIYTACKEKMGSTPAKQPSLKNKLIGSWDCTYDSEVGPVHHDRRYTFEPGGQATRIVYFNRIPLLDHYTWSLEGQALVLHDTKKGWVDSFCVDEINTEELHLTQYFFNPPAKQTFIKVNIEN